MMKEKNEYIENLLYGYFAGELSEIQLKELVAWLEADESHQKTFSEMSDWWAIAHVPLFASERKANFETHFSDLISPEAAVCPRRRFLFSMPGRIAAAVLVLLATSILSYYIGMHTAIPMDEPFAYFETEVPLGSQSKIILPDQSVVWINAGSTLRYNKEYNQTNREIYLNGEAYFEVTPDTLKPFVVNSENMSVKVLGTCFNVKAYADDATMDVSLVSGKVHVALPDKNVRMNEVELQPNRMLSYNKSTEALVMSEVNGEYAYEWTKGVFRFNEQDFAQLAKTLERKYNVRIHIESERLKNEVFSGSFSRQYTLNDILNEVDVDYKYTWIQQGSDFYIRDKS